MLRGSSASVDDPPFVPPSVRPGPIELTFGGSGARGVLAAGGALPRTRPGWEKGSDLLAEREQMLPIVCGEWER